MDKWAAYVTGQS
ncbi:hypothetical protein predicted by Glimmer/Critica [Bartonella tribocorum CIP 105476]|nr:hypothetical protein predicted by Glimmer/Critica [Bartonella tribocorum CIP 105476]CAK01452.1 hypothetical protein predicted by Glimmer/Critica [Bartonella tribocorum CIP 105476]